MSGVNSVGLADLLVVLVFFGVMIGVGLFYAKRQKSSRQYFGSDKSGKCSVKFNRSGRNNGIG